MRIAFIIPAFLPARDFGGPLYNTIALGQQYVRNGHEVIIYTSNATSLKKHDKNMKSMEEMLGMTVKRFPIIAKVGGYWINPSIYGSLMKGGFDVMHTQCLRCFQSDVAAYVSKKTDIPLVITSHGSLGSILSHQLSFKQRTLHAWHNPLDSRIMKVAKRMIATNEFEKSLYQKYGIEEEKIVLIPVGVDFREFEGTDSDFRKQAGIGEEEIVLLFVGRYNPFKGLDTLVKAFTTFVSKGYSGPRVRLVLIGRDDGYYSELLDLVKTHDATNSVMVLENQPREVIVSAYKVCDIFMLPSHYDTFPVTMLEAFACGKPIIASRVGGIPEVVKHDENGLLVEPGSPEPLAEAIRTLVQDDSRRKTLGQKGKELAEKYNIVNIARKMIEMYAEIV